VEFTHVNQRGFDVAGLTANFLKNGPPAGSGHAVRDMNRLARHVPVDEHQRPIEFLELAMRSRGAPMLGVLKADADSLGAAIGRCLDQAADLTPLRALSTRLEDFFASQLDQQMRQDIRWKNLYTVFSGGDDVLLVGPWDITLDFADHMRQLFARQFQEEQLTVSAGMAIIKPKFPIRLAAQQAEDLLIKAKSEAAPHTSTPKDQCATLGGLWKWERHDAIISAGKRLADWVDNGPLQRGWLHTVLELALLRRGEAPGRDPGLSPAMATSRLAYHVGRNWPKSGPPRDWIDRIASEFDRFETSTHVDTIYLPAILRYALLATRSTGIGDEA
jgi:CRISPR-associated protein Csm1